MEYDELSGFLNEQRIQAEEEDYYRERSHGHSKSRRRDKSRERRRRSRDKSYDRKRDRSSDKSRDRSRDRERRKRDRDRERERYLDRDREREQERSYDKYNNRVDYDEPSNTVMIKDLPPYLTEDEIKVGLNEVQSNYIAVRLVKDRKSIIDQNIALIEFIMVNDARQLMQDTKGEMKVSGVTVRMCYGYNVKDEVDRYDSEKVNSWKYEKPTNTIMMRGLTNMIGEIQIRNIVMEVSRHVIDVRLIRDKKTGMSRGFGFVEFDSVSEAKNWMDYQQGYLNVAGVELKLSYTNARQALNTGPDAFNTDSGDWACARCGGHNFKRRDFCYKCHLSKSQSRSVMETIDGKDQIGNTPCNTLILRDLDALTQEQSIINALVSQFNVDVTQCEIMRDDVTKVSRCFAFVELSALSDAKRVVDYYRTYPECIFELSGKAITVDFAKNTYNTIMQSYKEALAKRFEDYFLQFESAGTGNSNDGQSGSNYDANAAAAVAQAALNQKKERDDRRCISHATRRSRSKSPVKHKSGAPPITFEILVNGVKYNNVPTKPFNMNAVSITKFSTPDLSKFLFDQSTNYYYDTITGLYYDANSQYFFDRISQKYVYWDSTNTTYVPVDMAALASQATSISNENKAKAAKKSNNKSNDPKKIAKEMDKWEKMMNSKKEINEVQNSSTQIISGEAAYSLMNRTNNESIVLNNTINVVPAYSGDSDDNNASPVPIVSPEVVSSGLPRSLSPNSILREEEVKLINWERLACLLCNRGFKDSATLEKHQEKSDLHKTNLDKLREKLGLPKSVISIQIEQPQSVHQINMPYRDRAKERRDKFGSSSPPKRRSDFPPTSIVITPQNSTVEIPIESHGILPIPGLSTSNEAPIPAQAPAVSKMMEKMGWQLGQGLGKSNQGRTEIIQAEMHSQGAGIGAGVKLNVNPSTGTLAKPPANYRENLRKAMYAKYHNT